MRTTARAPRSRRLAIVSAMFVVAAVAVFQTVLILQNIDAHRDASHIIALTGAQRARIQEISYLALGLGIGSPERNARQRIDESIADMLTARQKVKSEPRFIVGTMNKNVVFSHKIDAYLDDVRKLEYDPRDRSTLSTLRRERPAVMREFDHVTIERVKIADDENFRLVRGLFAGLILQMASIVGVWFVFVAPAERRASALFIELSDLANSDPLTRLANRARFAKALATSIGSTVPFALHYIDLDNFKVVNDRHGHGTGDTVLQVAAERLRSCTRPEDTIVRLGGDEFAVIQAGPVDRDRAALLGQRIVEALSNPTSIDGIAHDVGASVGIALCPQDGVDSSALTEAADRALYTSKKRGRGRYSFFGGPTELRSNASR